MALAVTLAVACGGSAGPAGGGAARDGGASQDGGAGGLPDGGGLPASVGAYFTYTFEDKVFRIDARAGSTPEDVSARLARFGAGTRDRWLVPSLNGATT